MKEKLDEIFDFLSRDENRKYNHELQEKCYNADLKPYKSNQDKILSLLDRVVNTQPKPDMDMLAISFQYFNKNPDCFDSLDSFLIHLSNYDYKNANPKNDQSKNNGKFNLLFLGMQDQPGWGPKTAALFVKSIYHLHNGKYGHNDGLKIWDDVPVTIENGDILRLPVDEVIFQIFKKISPKKFIEGKNGRRDKNIHWKFKNVNEEIYDYLKEYGKDIKDIEIWDDLWFWGFITQRKKENIRVFEFNDSKYWSQRDTSKDTDTIKEIEEKANEFIRIVIN